MIKRRKSGGWGLKAFTISGIVLGLVLLAQTVGTYVYVSGNLVVQQARRDADRRVNSLQRSLRRLDPDDTATLDSVLGELFLEWEGSVQWMRVLGPSGVMAESGSPVGDPPVLEFRGISSAREGRFSETRMTPEGSVFVTVLPVRLGVGASTAAAPGDRDGRADLARGLAMVEIAMDLASVSAPFAALRRNLVIGVTAAFALLGMVTLVGLRFPHYLRGKRLENQLELARQVQANLLPAASAAVRAADISAECRPAWRVGGDFYDAFETDRGDLALMVGDVSGKGISTAPLMGFIHGAVHSSTWTESARSHEMASARLNELLHAKTAPERFVTLFWSYFEENGSTLKYVNAGHVPPVLFRSGSGGAEVVRLDSGGPVLGAIPGAHYVQGQVQLESGDLLVAYSDGIVESENLAGEEFGEVRLIEAVQACWGSSTEELRDRVLATLDAFTDGSEAEDDRTLLVVRFEPDRWQVAPEATDAIPDLVVYS